MTNKEPAGFLIRFLAEALEFFLFSLILTLTLFYLASSQTLAQFVYGFLVYLLAIALPLSIIGVIYRPVLTRYFGGNLGKLLVGLKVTTLHNIPLTLKQGLFRYTIGYAFSAVLFGLGFWSVIKDKEKRAFHDKVVGSKVVVAKNIWPLGLLILIALIVTHGVILSQTLNILSRSPLKSEFGYLMLNLSQQLKSPTEQNKLKPATPSANPN